MRGMAMRKIVDTSQVSYLSYAEASLAAAAASKTRATRVLYEEECQLWLILAQQRRAIEAVVTRYVEDAEAA